VMFGKKFVIGLVVVAVCMCCVNAAKRTVMPWMCLERCGEKIDADLAAILEAGPEVFPSVSIEAYDLDYGASIKDCGYSRVGPKLVANKINVQPMITTANINKLRDLWKDPKGFIAQAMGVARNNSNWITGFNIDFEPEGGETPTHEDAANFADFVDLFGKALHAEGFYLTVDIANWCTLFEDDLLAKTDVDRFITMSTYSVGLERFEEIVKDKAAAYGAKAGIGLSTSYGWSASDVQQRLEIVKNANIDTFAIWQAPVPQDWWPYLKSFVSGN